MYFHHKLVEAEMHFGGVIVNKVHYEGEVAKPGPKLVGQLTELLGDPDLARPRLREPRGLPRPGQARPAQYRPPRARARRPAVIEVPYLDDDVHDLAGLMEVDRYLFASGRKERAAIAAGV